MFKNTIWPEMPFKTQHFIPTTEKEIDVLLENPLRQHADDRNRTWAPSTTGNNYWRSQKLWSRPDFQQEKSKKKSNSTAKCQRNTRRREMSHNVYLVLVRRFDHCHVLRHTVLELLWLELESCKHTAWRHCRRLCGYFLCFGCNQQETED